MLKSAFLLTLLLSTGVAHAGDDFDERVARARKVERSSPAGRDYLMRYMPETNAAFEKIYSDCSRLGRKGEAEIFTLVFDIDATGSVTHVTVAEKDRNEYTRCYAEGMTRIKGPPPPESFAEKGFPAVIEATHHIKP
nr:hypothetical protein [Pseudoxanthomonas sp.]